MLWVTFFRFFHISIDNWLILDIIKIVQSLDSIIFPWRIIFFKTARLKLQIWSLLQWTEASIYSQFFQFPLFFFVAWLLCYNSFWSLPSPPARRGNGHPEILVDYICRFGGSPVCGSRPSRISHLIFYLFSHQSQILFSNTLSQ